MSFAYPCGGENDEIVSLVKAVGYKYTAVMKKKRRPIETDYYLIHRQKYKIGIYKDTFSNNRGADIAIKNLASGLSERGHVVTLFDKSEFAENVHGDEVEGLPPIIQQFHTDPKYPFRHWFKRWRRNRAIKAALKKVSAFQVLREAHVGILQKLLGGISKDRISVIGNWSSFEGCNSQDAQVEKVIICPGAINKDKNQLLLVNAFAHIADEFSDLWQG